MSLTSLVAEVLLATAVSGLDEKEEKDGEGGGGLRAAHVKSQCLMADAQLLLADGFLHLDLSGIFCAM